MTQTFGSALGQLQQAHLCVCFLLKSNLRSLNHENKKNEQTLHGIDNSFHHYIRHKNYEIELAVVFSVPRAGGHDRDTSVRSRHTTISNTPYI